METGSETERVMEKSPLIFTIIGGGLAGTAMLCQFVAAFRSGLLKKRERPPSIEIHIIEKNRVFGPGFPHSDQNAMPFHLINMCARDMSILFSKPNDFQSWADRHCHPREKRVPDFMEFGHKRLSPDPECHHYPRPTMGEYLKARFKQAVLKAEGMGIRVRLYPGHEVVNLWEKADDRVQIEVLNLDSGKEMALSANRVLLATGHWFVERNDLRYFASPWPAALLQSHIPEDAKVAIIGTSLSAIDAVLTLTAQGTFSETASGELRYRTTEKPRYLTLYSRKGLFPAVRGQRGSYKNRFLTPEKIQGLINGKKDLALEDLFALLDMDLKEAYGRPFPWKDVMDPNRTPAERLQKHIQDARHGDGPHGELIWQTVLQQVFPMVRELYLALSRKERMRFERDYSTLFFSHAAPMPMVNALKLKALMQSGILEVRPLRKKPSFKMKGDSFCFVYKGPKNETLTASHPFLVDARGQSRFYDQNPQALAVNLLKSGTVQIEPVALEPGEEEMKTGRAAKAPLNGTGSLWVDPFTHRVQRMGINGRVIISDLIYAVGAMTRGQIIDASMAHGSAVSTQTIALNWVDEIFSNRLNP
ncbi:MAG: FAD/NAD(P)-binding protein [Deltaproteobacteria bacterium]|nr:FAD/NAD(P)-binding protein [Deltaproteobacteria bacterium]